MELHPRHKKRALADVDVSISLLDIIKKYDLTYGEVFTILGNKITHYAKYLKVDEDNK